MKTKPTKKDENRVLAILEQLDWMFGTQNYERILVFRKEAEKDNDNCAAQITRFEDYYRLKIEIFPCFWEETLEDQRMMLLHEFCHTLIGPMVDLVDSARKGILITEEQTRHLNERTTSQMTSILDALLRGRKTFMKNAYKAYLQ